MSEVQRLTPDLVPAFLRLVGDDQGDVAARTAQVRQRLVERADMPHRYVVCTDAGGVTLAAVTMDWQPQLGTTRFYWNGEAAALGDVPRLLVTCRAELSALAPRYAWTHSRVARPDLEALEPFRWVPLEQLGREPFANLVARGGAGPSWDPSDTGAAVLDALFDTELVPACEAAFLPGVEAPVGFVIAAARPSTGWCTVWFLGLDPAHRGKGLGPWLHRRGFALMRAAGGVTYHGGTSTLNAPMLALFERHGLPQVGRYGEWRTSIGLEPDASTP